ncbi:MFS transporter [Thorsellia kenyensis]|uniref:MFS transporter n=1 Tax=Thorsellia kenyensis TaxID=1549888 RepID=A0ABV6C7I8_9GAMM
MSNNQSKPPSMSKVATASFIGTAIEYYDFYIYATAVALVIGPIFFPPGDASAQTLNAFVTFGIAFVARPIGSLLFGHFGDRLGRKTVLVSSLLLMGIATTLIGLLPSYAQWGIAAPVILCVLRFLQGLGLGGEWGGAALLATEYAPKNKKAWYGMFPQLGPSVGFLLSSGIFFLLSISLTDDAFKSWGWRVPFVLSAVLVVIGLYVRLSIAETPAFKKAQEKQQLSKAPVKEVLTKHAKPLVLGSLSMVVCYALFYIATVYTLKHSTEYMGFSRSDILPLMCGAIVFMAIATPISAALCDKFGRKPILIISGIIAFMTGFTLEPLLGFGYWGIFAFLALSLFMMGMTFAPMGAFLPELFPTQVRYTGASFAYNLGGILGASLAPYLAQKLFLMGGLSYVGFYISIAASISLLALFLTHETKDTNLQV